MSSIFNLENPFFRFMSKVADVIVLGMIALVFCIPVVTIVPTVTAVYYVTLKTVRDEEGYLWRSFWKSFKMNFKQGVIINIIAIVLVAVFTVDVRYFYQVGIVEQNQMYKLLFGIMIGISFIAVSTLLYVFPVLARFDNTVKGILKNAMLMSVKHLPATIGVILITIVAVFVVYLVPPLILFIIAIWAFANSYIFVKIFDNYMPKDDRDPDAFEMSVNENEETVTVDTEKPNIEK